MPVPTATFRNMKVLNFIFLVSAALFLFSILLLVKVDSEREFNPYQRAGRAWDAAMQQDAQRLMESSNLQERINQINEEILARREQIASDPALMQAQQALSEATVEKNKNKLLLDTVNGEIGPLEQQINFAILQQGEDSRQVEDLQKKLAQVRNRSAELTARIVNYDQQINRATQIIEERQQAVAAMESEKTRLENERAQLQEKLAELNPTGAAAIGEVLRNAPLLDWLNPSYGPQQDVVPAIRTDLNFQTVQTIDRCRSCHINIDKPAYAPDNFLLFVERQVALGEPYNININEVERPFVLAEFWINAARTAGLSKQVDRLMGEVFESINQKRGVLNLPAVDFLTAQQKLQSVQAQYDTARAQLQALNPKDDSYKKAQQEVAKLRQQWRETTEELVQLLNSHITALTKVGASSRGDVTADELNQPAMHFRSDLLTLLRDHVGEKEFELLKRTYRKALIDTYNDQRASKGLARLDDSPVLMGHPQIERFASPDSTHPASTMGCTACHEGSGQETQFEHTAHTPRDIWVDAQSGVIVPRFLLQREESNGQGAAPGLNTPNDSNVQVATAHASGGSRVVPASNTESNAANGAASKQTQKQSVWSQADTWILDPHDESHPYQPQHTDRTEAVYINPQNPGEVRRVIKQEDYWKKAYGWAHVHYMHWEKPMHSLAYVESSCSKCHTEVFDLQDSAPLLFEGRKLFAQVGCVNCHAVADVEDDLDIKQVGPSLVHVKEKLTPDMIASWVWSPRALRPTTRMPHYFMLENNSSPMDIRRTRTEVAAMAWYLMTTQPTEAYYETNNLPYPEYQPEELPEAHATVATEESIALGKDLFNQLGCLACHMNLEDQSQPLLLQAVIKQEQVSLDEAKDIVTNKMSYNERHWYAQRYMGSDLNLVGPELSAVGTKLMAGRPADTQEARAKSYQDAKQWLYNWLRNPRHYSSYTIMPSLRLTEDEAAAMSDYLLSLQRPTGSGEDEYHVGRFIGANGEHIDRQMLEEIYVELTAGQSSAPLEREKLRNDPSMTIDEQLKFVGQKMVSHYGCSGCHQINGMEDVVSACTSLDDWGLKDPHKLDFGYYDHVSADKRVRPVPTFKVENEGLKAWATLVGDPKNSPQQAEAGVTPVLNAAQAIEERPLKWENLHEDERRPWLYQKLHNPRVYDRGKIMLESSSAANAYPTASIGEGLDLGRPYDKLKMPKFYLNDRQVHAMVAYVTSVRKPLVEKDMQQQTYDSAMDKVAKGRQVATLYNCYGCHNIEGDSVTIHPYYNVYNPDGSMNDNLANRAPPRLMGQGSKTKPEWLYHFLQNVNGQPNPLSQVHPTITGEDKIRPWLDVRMPSFPLDDADAQALVDYFAGSSQLLSENLAQMVGRIDRYINEFDEQIARIARTLESKQKQLEGTEDATLKAVLERQVADLESELKRYLENRNSRSQNWMDSSDENVRQAMGRMEQFALDADLIPNRRAVSARYTDSDTRRNTWIQLKGQLTALAKAWQTDYPYVKQPSPVVSAIDFERGRALFKEMGCSTGECHRMGDEAILATLQLDAPAIPEGSEGDFDYGGGEDDYGYGEDAGGNQQQADADDYGYGEAAEGEDDPYGADPYGTDAQARADGQGSIASIDMLIAATNNPPDGAPNLIRAHRRLQRGWVEQWLSFAHTIQPGTRMNEFFKPADIERFWQNPHANLVSAFAMHGALQEEYESKLGYTSEQQRTYLIDFVMAAGHRHMTFDLDVQPVAGAAYEQPELTQVQKPVQSKRSSKTDIPGMQLGESEQPQAQTPTPVPDAKPTDRSVIENFHDDPVAEFDGEQSRIIGMVTYGGSKPRLRPLGMAKDPYCASFWRGKNLPREYTAPFVNDDGSLPNVMVHIVAGHENLPKGAPAHAAVIDQEGCVYVPLVTAVVADQTVIIKTSDATSHNVLFNSRNNGTFNQTLPAVPGAALNKTFKQAEIGTSLACSVHPWMKGWMHVMDHPYFSVSDVEGKFEITGLSPGTYTLEVWYYIPGVGLVEPQTAQVTVEAGRSHRLDLTLNRQE